MVGGGNTAVEEALYLSNIAKSVTVVHRRDKFRAEAILIDRLLAEDRQTAATCASRGTTRSTRSSATPPASPARASRTRGPAPRTTCPVHGVFIAIGHTPNTQIFEGQLDMAGGYIKVKSGTRRQRDRDAACRACSPPATSPITSTGRR